VVESTGRRRAQWSDRATREERTGWRRHESGGGERTPRGKGVGRAEMSRVCWLPNGGAISAWVKIDVGCWPRKNGRNPAGFWAPRGPLDCLALVTLSDTTLDSRSFIQCSTASFSSREAYRALQSGGQLDPDRLKVGHTKLPTKVNLIQWAPSSQEDQQQSLPLPLTHSRPRRIIL
jgi:hypothetical protein